MPQTFKFPPFQKGLFPQADPFSGPQDALLNMNALEFDQEGAIVITGGTLNLNAGNNYPADAHTLYSKFISGVIKSYQALTDGSIYRDTTSIVTGGSATRACFAAAFNYVFMFSGSKRKRDDGATVTDLGVTAPSALTATAGGAGVLSGSYQYAQVAVYNSGTGYIVQSPLSTVIPYFTLASQVGHITPATPSGIANEMWVFRRGGTLDKWYRIARLTSSFAAFDDNMSDVDALDLGVTTNEYLVNVTTAGIAEDILGAVGLINGRMIYFGATNIYFSVLNSPDSIDTRTSIPLGANQSTGTEIFLNAYKVAENIIVVATTQDIYILAGTYITLPDGTLDVSLRALGIDNPPIAISMDTWNGYLIYMSADGWRLYNPISGDTQYLVNPTMRDIYAGKTLNSNAGVPIFLYPAVDSGSVQVNYQVAESRNKLYCVVPTITNNDPTQPFTYTMHVYDLLRKYWRVYSTGTGTPIRLHAREDDAVTGFFSLSGPTRNLRLIDAKTSITLNGSSQSVRLRTLYFDFGLRARKDIYTLRLLVDTGGDTINLTINVNDGASFLSKSFSSSGVSEICIDIAGTYKTIQLDFNGNVSSSFKLSAIYFDFDPRPSQLTFFRMLKYQDQRTDAQYKRVRCWPIIIDTQGQNVNWNILGDGTTVETVVINTNGKRTVFYTPSFDFNNIDIGLELHAQTSTPFELYDVLPPEIVETYPIQLKFWQSGPLELFGSGFISQFRIRCIPLGTSLPYTIYYGDISIATGNITVVNGVDDVYYVPIQVDKNNLSGRVFRIELGPASFLFSPYYVQVQVQRAGKDTENEWIDLHQQVFNPLVQQ